MDEKEFWNKYRDQLDKLHSELSSHENIHGYNIFIQAMSLYSKEYAQLIIKNLVLINGGALIALPAFVGLIDSIDKSNVVFSAVAYAFGLVLAVICALFAFLCVSNSMRGLENRKSSKHYNLFPTYMKEFYSEDFLNDMKIDADELDVNATKYFLKMETKETIAIVLGILSLISFITGVLLLIINIDISI